MNVSKSPSAIADELRCSEKIRISSQTALATEGSVNQSTISRILSGDFQRLSKTVRWLCEYAKVDVYMHEEGPTASSRIAEVLRELELRPTPQKRKLLTILRIASELLDEK